MTEHPILIHPEYWTNSHLSIARHYGGIIFQMRTYMVEPVKDYLVMREFWKLLRPKGELTIDDLVNIANKPYDEATALDVAQRLNRILKARKTEQNHTTGTLNF